MNDRPWCSIKRVLTMAQKCTIMLLYDNYKKHVANAVYKRIIDRLHNLGIITSTLQLTSLGMEIVKIIIQAGSLEVKIVIRECIRNMDHTRIES